MVSSFYLIYVSYHPFRALRIFPDIVMIMTHPYNIACVEQRQIDIKLGANNSQSTLPLGPCPRVAYYAE